eukprot:CAMPEP_0113471482 /NCGR_PEP_ID=MMETSP0014_2-20120614/16999_1 /TAXON_ID=2857 /ORGANISM="Nitzschia sp." /LENGTH=234 /DNA_ID=CAMNT_0000364115 /DNA_START=324 /DNA_END=1028 /DNA_ORIENTATION=+ /assembly_acc=CAM_ASM_000159
MCLLVVVPAAAVLLLLLGDVSAFQSSSVVPSKTATATTTTTTTTTQNSGNGVLMPSSAASSLFMADDNSSQHQDEIERQLEKARAVLAISRAKIDANTAVDIDDDNVGDDGIDVEIDTQSLQQQRKGALPSNVPFFASTASTGGNKKKEKVIKNQNEDDGTFTTDGDLMAKLSEQEEWESRSLFEVFRNERKASTDDALSDRDVAASIYGLRKSLQLEDFQKIFDKRNRFIGDQ